MMLDDEALYTLTKADWTRCKPMFIDTVGVSKSTLVSK